MRPLNQRMLWLLCAAAAGAALHSNAYTSANGRFPIAAETTTIRHAQELAVSVPIQRGIHLDDRFHESCHKRGIHLSSQTPISAVGGLETKDEKEWQRGGGRLKCRLEMRTSRT